MSGKQVDSTWTEVAFSCGVCLFLAAAAALLISATIYGVWLVFKTFGWLAGLASTNSIEDEEKRIKAKAGHVDEKKDCVRGDEFCNSTDQLLPQAGKLGTSMSSGDAHINANTS